MTRAAKAGLLLLAAILLVHPPAARAEDEAPAPRGRLHGVVLDETGAPAAGADVRLYGMGVLGGCFPADPVRSGFDPEGLHRATATTKTDSKGRWAVVGLPPATSYTVEVVGAAGEPSAGVWGVALDGIGPSVRSRLLPSRPFRGRLVDETGAGTAGFVWVDVEPGSSAWGSGLSHPTLTIARQVRTSKDGRFEFRAPPGLRLRLNIHHPGVASLSHLDVPGPPKVATSDSAPRDIAVRDKHGSTVEGTVRDEAGEPVAGAHVVVRARPPQYRHWAGHAAGYAVTNAEGHYRVPYLRGAVLSEISVSADGFVAEHRFRARGWPGSGIPLVPDRPFVADILLRRSRTLEGRVLDEAGKPLPRANVAFALEVEGVVGLRPWRALTDTSGRFELPRVPIDAGRLHVDAVGFRQALEGGTRRPAAIVEGGTAGETTSVDVVMSRGQAVSGHLRDRDGGPVAGARVTVQLTGASGSIWTCYALSADDGRYELEGVAGDARQYISVEADGYVSARVHAAPAGAAQAAPLTILMDHAARVAGRVVDAGGRGLAGVRVCCGDPLRAARTDTRGRFELDGVPPGRQTLVCGTQHAPFVQRVLDVTPGARIRDVALRHPGTREIAGIVVDGDGVPVAGVAVQVAGQLPNYGHHGATTNAAGRFRVTHLPVGGYVVTAGPQKRRPPAVQAGTTDLRLVLPADYIELLEGTVVDAAGNPVANADVQIAFPGDGKNVVRGASHVYGGRFRVGVPSATPKVTLRILRPTDAFGRPLNLKERTVENVRVADGSVAIRLEVALTISGAAIDWKGRGIPNLRVNAVPADRPYYQYGLGVLATTDEQGLYLLTGLSPGEYRITTKALGAYAPARVLSVSAGSQGVRLQVRRYRSIVGRVVDEKGKPVSAVRVLSQHKSRTPGVVPPSVHYDRSSMNRTSETDADGRFKLEYLPPEYVYTISTVLPASLKDAYFPIQLDRHDPTEEPLLLQLKRGLSISGRVTDAEGKPVAAIRVTTRGAPGPNEKPPAVLSHMSYTGDDGRYTIGPLPEGERVRVRFTHTDHHRKQGRAWLPLVCEDVAAGVEELDVTLDAGASITGRIDGATPVELKGMTLGIRKKTRKLPNHTFRFDGTTTTFSFRGLEPGTYTIARGRVGPRTVELSLATKVTAPAEDVVLKRRFRFPLRGRLQGVDPRGFSATFFAPGARRKPRPRSVQTNGSFDLGTQYNEPGVLLITSPKRTHVVYMELTPSKGIVTAKAVEALTISGRILDLPDKVNGGRISASRGPVTFKGTVAEDGWFEIRGLPPGLWDISLVAGHPTGGAFEVKTPVRAGEQGVFAWWRPAK